MKIEHLTWVPGFVAGILGGIMIGAVLGAALTYEPGSEPQQAVLPPPQPTAEARPTQEPIDHRLPDQAHAMADVAYHFSNLFFAGKASNWPLAEFYLAETRAHLRWAVGIKPIRPAPEGGDLDIAAILETIDQSALADLANAIKAKDARLFDDSYRTTVEACYSCHTTAGKPFLRLRVPESPSEHLIDFNPVPAQP